MICESAFTDETTFPLLQLGIKKWYCLGCSCCSKLSLKRDLLRSKLLILSDGVTSISFEPFRISNKTLRKLVVCGVENVIVIKMSFCCLADAAVLKYTIYTPISSVCENKNDGQTGVHKSSPIRSKWMTYWPM